MNRNVDPFTRASPTYQAAMRHPHKSGSAWEGYAPRGPILTRKAKTLIGVTLVAAVAVAAVWLRG